MSEIQIAMLVVGCVLAALYILTRKDINPDADATDCTQCIVCANGGNFDYCNTQPGAVNYLCEYHLYAPRSFHKKVQEMVVYLARPGSDRTVFIRPCNIGKMAELGMGYKGGNRDEGFKRIKNYLAGHPECFGSNPNAQAQAENGCETCPHALVCLSAQKEYVDRVVDDLCKFGRPRFQ